MPSMGTYCKAYPVERFRAFPGWAEKDWRSTKGTAATMNENGPPENPGHFYLQENYEVTADIFLDEYVVFDQVTDEWRAFCHDVLGFRLPVAKPPAAEKVATAAG